MFPFPPDTSNLTDAFQGARRDDAFAVLEGFHALKHAVRFGARVERVVVRDRALVERLCAQLAPDVEAAVMGAAEAVEPAVFDRLVPRPPHTGVVAIARRPAVDVGALARDAPVVLLEEPRRLENVGACVRVAAAVGAAGVVTTGPADPWSPEALRGSAGLHFAVPVARVDGPPTGRAVVALDADGAPFDPSAVPRGAVLAFGSERAGLSDALKAQGRRGGGAADAPRGLVAEPRDERQRGALRAGALRRVRARASAAGTSTSSCRARAGGAGSTSAAGRSSRPRRGGCRPSG
jgi:TrmH family RNA methyltransferase